MGETFHRESGDHGRCAAGDIEIRYQVTEAAMLNMGFQRSQRQVSCEPSPVLGINIWVGGRYSF